MRKTLLAVTLALLPVASRADISVITGGLERPEYFANGTTYVEAIRGRNYTLRITNPTGVRVAVALSVDGLNTIDAKHTSGWNAAKWVLDPYETVDIDGWQVSDSSARRFVFTGERQSYGAALGQTQNLGVIEAIFYRERTPRYQGGESRAKPRDEEHSAAEAPPPSAMRESDDYAATGMGDRTRHDVTSVSIDLDPHPIETVRIRYEFRPQLVKLGIFPRDPSPLARREKARGFEYCPEVK
ncbi:MAG TPA: hypothetical protein VKB93_07015 [Thermoanaerobaculia bacterium]|nr:hypothetical protein [Thermoanaerobaculia bacterium]